MRNHHAVDSIIILQDISRMIVQESSKSELHSHVAQPLEEASSAPVIRLLAHPARHQAEVSAEAPQLFLPLQERSCDVPAA